ncbi:helix-turn-helix domain-containing protein [Rhizobium herbae]|uniref:Transcriptional regulator with XRE-family HTH domain n=1 Tax=Rhizobium herbae TaxID=508661 RepID=A0ABS4EVU3_9HYPH|nr:helix-turn-helix transcriptional regulator [Rhizobium herbae]MBP1862080.1 transcriptional regulator with XRE-family HTH domain [Rhizobium herbae]
MKPPLPTDLYVGSKIRLQRTLLKMSQTALGERLGITFQQIQKYESGKNRVSPSKLHQISEILQVPISVFFPNGGRTDPASQSVEGSDELSLFLKSAEGRELNRAFQRILEPKLRRAVVVLAKSIAGENEIP